MNKKLAIKLYEAFFIQRWNDKLRIGNFTEMDKHAHKMIISFVLGKLEEEKGEKVNWINIINGGIFELLRRVTISDIKYTVQLEIKNNHKKVYKKLNDWVFTDCEPLIESTRLKKEFKNYLSNDHYFDPLTEDILYAAHRYAGYWEFQFIKKANPDDAEINEAEHSFLSDLSNYVHLEGIRKLFAEDELLDFIDLCGQLRFQIRWGRTPRIPETSVLGHVLVTAIFSYLFSDKIKASPKRKYNNFFGGLFHDLPEAVTRDIITPIKYAVPGMPEAILKIEAKLAQKKIYPLLTEGLKKDIAYYINDEFQSKIIKNDKIIKTTTDTISQKYDKKKFNPIDGELVKAADQLAAHLEIYTTKKIGLTPMDMEAYLAKSIKQYRDKKLAGLDMGKIFKDLS